MRHRRQWPRASTWIALLTGLSGAVQVTLGVARLVVPAYLPMENDSGDEVSGLVRIVFGVFLILLAKGLMERRRIAWVAAVALSAAQAAVSLHRAFQGEGVVLPVAELLSIAVLLAFHRRFSL